MTRTEVLDRSQPLTGYQIRAATGTYGVSWCVSRRVGDGTEYTHRLEWQLSNLAPRGGFWHDVQAELTLSAWIGCRAALGRRSH